MPPDPVKPSRRWNGAVNLFAVFAGGVIGYSAAMSLLIRPLVEATQAAGGVVPWQAVARLAGVGSVGGAVFFGVFMAVNEKLHAWQRLNRAREQREQDFSRLFERKNSQ